MALVWWLLLPVLIGAAFVSAAFVLLYALAAWLIELIASFRFGE